MTHEEKIGKLSETIVDVIDDTATDGILDLSVVIGALLDAAGWYIGHAPPDVRQEALFSVRQFVINGLEHNAELAAEHLAARDLMNMPIAGEA
jgi:hypothetical protein